MVTGTLAILIGLTVRVLLPLFVVLVLGTLLKALMGQRQEKQL
ncbi:MAG: hypothetical protein ABI847_06095 [Anaerolineales bacterium]